MDIRFVLQMILFLQFFSAMTFAQGIHFSISGKASYVNESKSDFLKEYNSFRYTPIHDSVYLREKFLITQNEEKTYIPTIGYETGLNLHIGDLKRIALKTGIALNFISFTMDSKFNQVNSIFLGTDTVQLNLNGGGVFIYVPCDSFTNSYSDILPIREGTIQNIFSLKIPLEISYQVIPGILSLQVGGYLQTPLFSSRSREYASSFSETINGKKICTYKKVVEKDNSGSGINNFQTGISASLAFRLLRNVNLELGVSKDMKNIFVKKEYQDYILDYSDYRPLKLSVGLAYHFGYHLPALEKE